MSKSLRQSIFQIDSEIAFEKTCLAIFDWQYRNNAVYRAFCEHLKKDPSKVKSIGAIPFLPIQFFKSKKVVAEKKNAEAIFFSSGTTGQTTSKHFVADLSLYREGALRTFEQCYGKPSELCILALLPSYLEREGSSLIYMVDFLMKQSQHAENGYFLDNFDLLQEKLARLEKANQKTLLIGVSFALLDFAQSHGMALKNTVVMETGGMKGRKKEMTRDELHSVLQNAFELKAIHSEYGMTELLSQAYSQGDGHFKTPPWMKVLTRDTEDPLTLLENDRTGGINIIDLANLYSCSFIATQDLGKISRNGSFEVLGRFDHTDVRGCNLMAV